VGKTFTAVAIGIARDEGSLDVDESVLSYLPDFAAGATAGADQITVRHLLTKRECFVTGASYRPTLSAR
jgi:CubicO group peptidase (beta-lactamase class C family)